MNVSLKQLLVVALAVSLSPVAVQCSRVKQVIESVALRNCSDDPPVKNRFHNPTIIQESRDFNYVTGAYKIDEPGSTRMKWKALVYKCTQRDALAEQEECEFFLKIERKNMCSDIKMKKIFWAPFFNSSKPPFVCPYPKGIYNFSRITLDLEEIQKLATGIPFVHNFFWVCRILMYKSNKMWSCFDYTFKLGTIKV